MNAYDRQHRSPEIRAQALRTLATLVEQYPNQRICQILGNAIPGDIYMTEDDDLVRALLSLQAHYGQFRAAGIPKERL